MHRQPLEYVRSILRLLRDAFDAYLRDDIPRLGAALAYYSVFSIGPLLLIVISITGFVLGPEAATGQIQQALDAIFGSEGAKTIQDIVQHAARPKAGVVASIIGVLTFGLAATGVFVELKHALNVVWGADDVKGGGARAFLRDRVLSFTLMLVIGFLSMVSLVASALVTAAARLLVVGEHAPVLVRIADLGISLTVFTVLIAAIFKLLPDTRIAWRDVWIGAAVTTGFFLVGRLALGATIGNTSSDVYGAARSLVLLLAWTYYCAQIFLIGAAITFAYAQRYGSRSGKLAPDEAPVDLSKPAPRPKPAPPEKPTPPTIAPAHA